MEFVFDLAGHETARLAAVLDAVDGTYDPVGVLEDERAAHALLYSNLNPEQEAVYRRLVTAGVLDA